MWYGSMVVRIVHGQAGSLYASLLKEKSTSSSQEQSKGVQAKTAQSRGVVAQQAPTSDAVKVTLSTQGGQAIPNLVRAASMSESIVTSVKPMRASASSERIETYKEAKEVTNDLTKKMEDDPEASLEAHDVSGLPNKGSSMQ